MFLRSLIASLATVACCSFLPAQDSLRVMSFNIRYGTAKDGDDHWDRRRELVVKTIEHFSPDLLGTQETLEFQADYIAQQLSEYSYFGRSRMKTPNEHCGIFYRTERFTWLAGGHFWLSETPEVPESQGWDAALPRMASWVLLSDNRDEKSPAILFVNTHFDHRGQNARSSAAKLMRHRISKLAAITDNPRIVVTGDFNAGEGSEPYRGLLEENNELVDTYRLLHPIRAEHEGSFNGFKGETKGARIDWILASPQLKCLSADIDRTNLDGRYPSDHCPVTAVFEFPMVKR